jgi:transcription factor E
MAKKKKIVKKIAVPHKKVSKPSISEPKIKREVVTKQNVKDTILAVSGDFGVRVIDFLGDKKNVSEFIIADKLKLDMQTIRNTLYKLHTHNIANYIRKKDRQKGWYISYWTFNKSRIKEMMHNMKKMQLEKLRERLDKEESSKGVFYICPKACARLDFDQATEFAYKCPECGSLLNQQENIRTIEHLKEKIQELECSNGTC